MAKALLDVNSINDSFDKEKNNQNKIILIVILLNFLASIAFELYAPSLPTIAKEFKISEALMKNTITATMVGYSLGSLIFGFLIDSIGRKKILAFTLFLFIVVSLLAVFSSSILQLTLARFFQGVLVSTAAICSRAFVSDYFDGKLYMAVILYTTIASSLGLIIGPLIGGYFQYYFNWQYNFYTYAAIACIVECLLLLFIRDSVTAKSSLTSLRDVAAIFLKIINSKVFLACSSISSLIVISLLIYPTICGFLIQETLGYSSKVYANCAVLVGLSFLLGTASNRALLNYFSQKRQVYFGFNLMMMTVCLQFYLALFSGLTLLTLVLPICLINFSIGFIQSNILGFCIRLFPKNVGVTTAMQACLVMLLGSVGIYLISMLEITHLFDVAKIFLILVISEFIIFFIFIKEKLIKN